MYCSVIPALPRSLRLQNSVVLLFPDLKTPGTQEEEVVRRVTGVNITHVDNAGFMGMDLEFHIMLNCHQLEIHKF